MFELINFGFPVFLKSIERQVWLIASYTCPKFFHVTTDSAFCASNKVLIVALNELPYDVPDFGEEIRS